MAVKGTAVNAQYFEARMTREALLSSLWASREMTNEEVVFQRKATFRTEGYMNKGELAQMYCKCWWKDSKDAVRAKNNAQVERDLPNIRHFENEISRREVAPQALIVTNEFYVSLVWAGRLNPHQPREFMGIPIYRTRDLSTGIDWEVT